MESRELFLTTKPHRLFFIAAIPGAVSMLFGALYGIFDGAFVGRILGEQAFAAINLAIPFVIINFALSDLIGVGASVPISIYLGQNEDEQADNVFSMACLMIVLTGSALGAALYAASPWMLRMMGAEGELARLAVRYIRVYALCSPITTIVFALDNFLRISGKLKLSMWLNIVMSLLTLVLEYIFLAVLRLSIWSAALANCISMAVAAAFALYPFFRGKLQLKFVRPRFSIFETVRIVKSGLPTFLSNIAGRITSIAINIALLKFGGEEAVAVYGILMYAGDAVQPILYGICDSLQPAIGCNWGAGRYDRVSELARCCFIAAALIGAVSAAVLMLFPVQLASIFSDNTAPDFLAAVSFSMRLFGLSRLLQWFCFAVQSYMSAVEKPLYSGVISVGATFVFPMLSLLVLYPLRLTGIWLNPLSTMLLTFIVSAVLFRRFRRSVRDAGTS